MRVALLDSNVLFAHRSAADTFHEPATGIVEAMDTDQLPVGRVTNYILAEVLSLIGERLGKSTAIETFDMLVEGAGFDIAHATRTDFNAGQALYRRHDRLTFVDAVTVAYMRRTDIEHLYSFDDDFDVIEGITRLNAAADPFD